MWTVASIRAPFGRFYRLVSGPVPYPARVVIRTDELDFALAAVDGLEARRIRALWRRNARRRAPAPVRVRPSLPLPAGDLVTPIDTRRARGRCSPL